MKNLLSFTLQDETSEYDLYFLNGELDKAGLIEQKDNMEAAIDFYKKHLLVIDISGLKFINSEGIGFLMSLHAHLKTNGSELVLISPQPNVLDVFQAIGLPQIVRVIDSINQL